MTLEDYGWNDRFQSLFHDLSDENLTPARVVRVDRGAVSAQTNQGEDRRFHGGESQFRRRVGPG